MGVRMNLSEIEKRLKFKFPYELDEWFTEKHMCIENYHKHTTWSDFFQIDSATSLEDFMRKVEERDGTLLMSGEHGYPGEWLYVYDLCKQSQSESGRKKLGLTKPLRFRYSSEIYWVKDPVAVIVEEYVDKDGKTKTREKRDNTNCHMVVVARNYNAMRKLNYIISIANDTGYYYRPRVGLEQLLELSPEDVYITSACVAGWKYEDADDIWLRLAKHFGDSFFFEYQTHLTDKQKELNAHIFKLSREYNIQTIVGLDTHYIDEEDMIKRENLLLRKGLHYDDEDGWFMDYPTGEETYRRLMEQGVLPEDEIIYAMMNTHVFCDGCEDIEYDTGFKIPIMDEYKGWSYEKRAEELWKILNEEFQKEDDEHRTSEHYEGMQYEFGEIKDSGCVDYFLDNRAVVDKAINKYGGHLTTTSRGSAASYYTSKLCGFTTMDRFESEVPIYPQRFITKDRILSSHQMPDIDLNLEAQAPFVSASRELFGENGCYPLLAVGKLKEKSAFKVYAGVKGIEPSLANDVTTLIDQYNEDVKNADEEDKGSFNIEDYITDSNLLSLYKESLPYQSIIEQAKVHACGHVIFNGNPRQPDVVGYGDVRYEIGLIRCHSESTGRSVIVANVEGGLLDSYGYVKDDFLIVDVVGIIYKLYQKLGREVPSVSELRKMVDGDDMTWDLYANGITCCLNQCEKKSTTQKAMKYKPKNIKELAAFIAGIRPGFKSLINGFISRIPYTNGEKAIDDLLEDCFHYMLYQEAIMKIFSYLGIPMKDSYDTIKKISKKKLKGEALQHVESTLKEHWLKQIGNLDNFEAVYKVVKDSARYGFNAPHALAMACDSLYEAWVKAHHTSVFYEVALNHYQTKGDKNKVAELLAEAMKCFGYKMGDYQYGKGGLEFVVDNDTKTIYPAIASIKGIGEKAAYDMTEIAKTGKDNIVDVYISTNGTSINGSVFRDLIRIGYFSAFGSVKRLLACVDTVDAWKGQGWNGRKTISVSDLPSLDLSAEVVANFATNVLASGKISKKRYTIFDWQGLVKAICDKIPNEEYGAAQLCVMQYKVLGFCDKVMPNLSWRYCLVTSVNDRYSPVLNLYSPGLGKTTDMKVHKKKDRRNKKIKTTWADLKLSEGDFIYIKDWAKEPVRRNVDGKWIDDPVETYPWIYDYSLAYRDNEI